MTHFTSTAELAQEAREALRRSTESPRDHFQRLIRLGWINSRGEVTRLLDGDAEPEVAAPTADATDSVNPNGNGHT